MRRIVFKVALVGLGLTLASLLAEGLVRAIAPQFRTPLRVGIEDTILDPRYGWKWIPNSHHRYWHGVTVDINSLGLRDREYGPKQSGEFRILSLGDSYAYGFGLPLERTYTKVLERMLNARFPANRFSVINAGVSGYGTRQMTLSVRDLRDVLHPDFAVATFVAGNDVYDDWIFPGQLQQQAKTPLCWLGRHSHAARLFLKTIWPATFFVDNHDPRKIRNTIQLQRELEKELAASEIPYIMAIIPARHEIRPSVSRVASALIDLGLTKYLFLQNRMVIDHLAAEGVPYVDTYPALAARDRTESVVFAHDPHTNAIGHEVIAQAIFHAIEARVARILDRGSTNGSRTGDSP